MRHRGYLQIFITSLVLFPYLSIAQQTGEAHAALVHLNVSPTLAKRFNLTVGAHSDMSLSPAIISASESQDSRISAVMSLSVDRRQASSLRWLKMHGAFDFELGGQKAKITDLTLVLRSDQLGRRQALHSAGDPESVDLYLEGAKVGTERSDGTIFV